MFTLYSNYNNILSKNISDFLFGKVQTIKEVTNKESAIIVRNSIPIKELKKDGIFFTGDSLSYTASSYLQSINENSKILDPTCGNGNLLVSILNQLPKKQSLKKTLTTWGKILYGFDLYPEFIETVKLRIIIKALLLCTQIDIKDIEEMKQLLPNIQQGNIYDNKNTLDSITHLIMNPPFVNKIANVSWASGKINSAALIFYFCISNVNDNTQIIAILPHVLKSGSRYQKWRTAISKMTCEVQITTNGKFDKQTNIDVFIFKGTKNNNHNNIYFKRYNTDKTLNSFFDITVGTYVPFRAQPQGKVYPYLKPNNTTAWEIMNTDYLKSHVQFDGNPTKPPFVVIRRTSSPYDKYRALASVVIGITPSVVENHLIICKPKDNTDKTCEKLLKYLKSKNVNDFLNERIRCRHLTVSSVKEIPVGDLFNE